MINWFLIFAVLLIPVSGFAQDSPVKSVNNVIKILEKIVGWTYTIFFIAAAFFILMAAFKFLSVGDNPEKLSQAKKQIIYAVIAIIVALLSVSFDAIIKDFLGGSGSSGSSSSIQSPSVQSPSANQESSGYDPYAPWGINP